MKKLKVGFIGLGLMGSPMAKNILKKGFALSVYNRSPKKTEEFKKLGVSIRKSPRELAQDSDIIISMVTGPQDVEAVLLGKNGVIEGVRSGLITVDMSTIGPTAAIGISRKLAKKGIDFVDAPVTGSVVKALTGELTIFIGAKENIYRKVKPVLSAMGTDIQYIGAIGSGQAIKLINNHLVASSLTALGEAMLLSDLMKIPRRKIEQSLSNVFAVSPLMKMKMKNMINEDYTTAFSVSNMHKDEKLSLEEAEKKHVNLPLLRLVEKLYGIGLTIGLSQADNSAILAVLSKLKKEKRI